MNLIEKAKKRLGIGKKAETSNPTPAGKPASKLKRAKKQDQEVRRDTRLVRNNTDIPQIVGKDVFAMRGHPLGLDEGMLDVSPGTAGESLLQDGTLVLVDKPDVLHAPPSNRAELPEVDKRGEFTCPWCRAFKGNAGEVQVHILAGHCREILEYYAETYEEFVQGVKAISIRIPALEL